MQLPSPLMFALHLSIGVSSKGCCMGIGKNSSGWASAPVEGSEVAKPGAEASLDSWLA